MPVVVGKDESFFDENNENIFFPLIEQLCGAPVDNQCGLVFPVFVPTFE